MMNAFLIGNSLYLRPLQEADADGDYVGWLNDPVVCAHNSHHIFPYNKNKALAFIESTQTATDKIVLAVCLKKNDLHIGNISLQQIDLVNRSAEFAILLGNRQYWGKGVGKEAGQLLLKHGFMELNLHRIGCGTSAENTGMQRLALSLGMQEEGRRRGASYKQGKHVDIIEYGILEEDFNHPSRSGRLSGSKENADVK